MRQGKLSELIHNSAKFPNVEQCRVSVHFCDIADLPGRTDYDVISGTELVISRTANRQNKSQYYINDRSSNFTEVTDLLRARGIDLDHKRFLILQGEVESIAQMKPKAPNEHEDGLLEYLEDIIGTSSLKPAIEEAGKQVDALNDERAEKLNRVKIVEKDKDALEGKKDEALAYIALENDLSRVRNQMFQLYAAESQTVLETAQTRVNDLTARLRTEQDRNAELTAAIKQKESDYNQHLKEYEELGVEAKRAKSDFAAYEREYIQLQENTKHLKDKEKKSRKNLDKERLQVSEHESWSQNHTQDLAKLKAETERLTGALAAAESELETIRESLKGETQGFQLEIEEKQRELAPWADKRSQISSTIDVAQAEVDLLRAKVAATDTALAELAAQRTQIAEMMQSRKASLKQLAADKAATETKVEASRSEIASLTEQEPALAKKWRETREAVEEAKSSASSARDRGTMLSGLLKLRDKVKGIHGRLGDLGVIESKYDVAVTTACPALDNIVVDTTETGQKWYVFERIFLLFADGWLYSIEHLRKHNLGRATFIILDKIEKVAFYLWLFSFY